MNRIIRTLLIVCGTLCVGLAVVGIFVPILPTTPFLLLAAVCYARSSQRFLAWLLTNRWFGSYIKNYREGRGIPRREKVLTIAMLWLTIGFSALYAVSLWWVRVVLVLIAVGVTIHLLRIKTFRPDPEDPLVDRPLPAEQTEHGDN
jgi:uncharacterized membrane protein YbaN (DUF454 family)